MITLKPIDKDNWHAAIRLEVAPEQRNFVASNLYSIAESHFEPGAVPLGIYNDETLERCSTPVSVLRIPDASRVMNS